MAPDSVENEDKSPPVPASEAIPDPDALAELTELCALARRCSLEKSIIEGTQKELSKIINDKARELGLPRAVSWDEWTLRRAPGSKSEIKAEKLMERGVSLKVIQECTVTVSWEPYAVFPIKTKKPKGGGAAD